MGKKTLGKAHKFAFTLYKIQISYAAVMQGDRKSELAAGTFASSAMCVGPEVSQSGTDVSAGNR